MVEAAVDTVAEPADMVAAPTAVEPVDTEVVLAATVPEDTVSVEVLAEVSELASAREDLVVAPEVSVAVSEAWEEALALALSVVITAVPVVLGDSEVLVAMEVPAATVVPAATEEALVGSWVEPADTAAPGVPGSTAVAPAVLAAAGNGENEESRMCLC